MHNTYRDQFDSAMKCKTASEARAWLLTEINMYGRDYGIAPAEAERTIKINLGYMAGYCDREAQLKVKKLFDADHPIFGNPETRGEVEPKFAAKLGRDMGKKIAAKSRGRGV